MKILHLEDNALDGELISLALKEASIDCDIRRVVSGLDFERFLEIEDFDLILSDYSIPGFDGMSALKVAKAVRPDVPFIFVSGTIGEERAVESLKNGAIDYVLKDRTARLTSAVKRAHCESLAQKRRKEVEDELRESDQRFLSAFTHAPIGMALVRPNGRWLKVNHALCEIVGYSADELLTKTFQDITYPEDVNVDLEYVRRMLAGEIRTYQTEKRYYHKDGHVVWVLLSASMVCDEAGKPAYFISQIKDITKNKAAEEQIRQALREKEVLLKEIHHRVKNNMQVISSLLVMQSESVADESVRTILLDTQNRVRSMAMIHEKLYQSSSLAQVDFGDYVQVLSNYLFRTYSTNAERVSLKVTAQNVKLNIETASPCGLLLNELISNALKHAFKDGRSGELRVELKAETEGYSLTVADNGVGLPDDFDLTQSHSLGLQLIRTLAQQIKATLTIEGRSGAAFRLAFKELVCCSPTAQSKDSRR